MQLMQSESRVGGDVDNIKYPANDRNLPTLNLGSSGGIRTGMNEWVTSECRVASLLFFDIFPG